MSALRVSAAFMTAKRSCMRGLRLADHPYEEACGGLFPRKHFTFARFGRSADSGVGAAGSDGTDAAQIDRHVAAAHLCDDRRRGCGGTVIAVAAVLELLDFA
ncbi:hypothetical protein [Rhodopseudomonas telluris]|uniref:Uncharacterized protein n=1 Tax=Rhodopseudomonas telluris TaxID=644215 RepID=A0ABV6ELQ2_9BRAD